MALIDERSLDILFRNARTHNGWSDKPVSDQTLRELYDILKMPPTSANSSPARFAFIRSPEAKEKLLSTVIEGNYEKTKAAPVTVIVAMDMEFYEKLPKLFPHTDAKSWFKGNSSLIEETAFRNGTLQGAYLILAARAVGLDAGPMSGFDRAKADELFFKGTYWGATWKSNFLVNLGYGDPKKLFPRNPRLNFEEACKVL